MNDGNLRTLSPSEARAQGRRGGIRSGEARREKKRLRECLEECLSMTTELDGEEVTCAEAIAASMVREAMGGNVRAFCEIRDTVGEMPAQRVEVEPSIPPERYAEIEAILLGGDD